MAVVNVPADLAVYLDAYNYATTNTLATSIPFGNIHAGGSFGMRWITVQNTAGSGSYTENLAAVFGAMDLRLHGQRLDYRSGWRGLRQCDECRLESAIPPRVIRVAACR